MAKKPESVWHKAKKANRSSIHHAARKLIDLEPNVSGSRFLTVVGKSENPDLNLLTAYTEMVNFEKRFKNDPDEMAKLYGHLGNEICITVLDKEGPNGPLPACVCRIAIGNLDEPLPTLDVLKISRKKHGYSKRKSTWRITNGEYDEGMKVIEDDGGQIFDVATIANLDEYKDGVASLQVFSAFARMYDRNYHAFNGRFLTTIVTDVAGIVNTTTGHDVLNIFPGTKPAEFHGAKNTAPHIGLILPERFSPDMQKRMSTSDNERDTQNSTYLFI